MGIPVKTSAIDIDMGADSHLVCGILVAPIQRGRACHRQRGEVAILNVVISARKQPECAYAGVPLQSRTSAEHMEMVNEYQCSQ